MWGIRTTNHGHGEVIPVPTSGLHQITDMPAAPRKIQSNITFFLFHSFTVYCVSKGAAEGGA